VIEAMVRDFEVAEEHFQETVIKILKSEERFDPDFFRQHLDDLILPRLEQRFDVADDLFSFLG